MVLRASLAFGIDSGLDINIPQAELAILPSADSAVFHQLIGTFNVNNIHLPFNLPHLNSAQLTFDSQPGPGQPIVSISSSFPAGLTLASHLSIKPLSTAVLNAAFEVAAN